MPRTPFKLLTPAEIEELLDLLSFDELANLLNRAGSTTGDEEFTIEASKWLYERSNIHEHSRRGYPKRRIATAAHR